MSSIAASMVTPSDVNLWIISRALGPSGASRVWAPQEFRSVLRIRRFVI
jgi:hypothetical protein